MARLVTAQAGARPCALNHTFSGDGLARPADDLQAISTGTHGTDATIGCLSTFVEGLTLVTATGEALRCSAGEHPDVFTAARVGLGALGVITEVRLRRVDAFVLRAPRRPRC
ncbi:FAD/FMN-containing dehydrogenase [Catenuloplanes nepalensis]|uniref:FAD/FMN-containing dehydrogenase n=1 Tax=Catenuloplanes nepalensis TaxID=587533 RepID=A0ABT9N5F5_9ACTN|nr:hypothetical protein [Catenuloplanes nepalensis]MDP9798932.1 FAD/FMN-containing dehydrogenase [Catenuloplanes nepalensis]